MVAPTRRIHHRRHSGGLLLVAHRRMMGRIVGSVLSKQESGACERPWESGRLIQLGVRKVNVHPLSQWMEGSRAAQSLRPKHRINDLQNIFVLIAESLRRSQIYDGHIQTEHTVIPYPPQRLRSHFVPIPDPRYRCSSGRRTPEINRRPNHQRLLGGGMLNDTG